MAEKDSRDDEHDAMSSGAPPADAMPAVAPPPEPVLEDPPPAAEAETATAPAEKEPAPLAMAIEAIAEAILPAPPPEGDQFPQRPDISIPFSGRTDVTLVSLPTILQAATPEAPAAEEHTQREAPHHTPSPPIEISHPDAPDETVPPPPVFIPSKPEAPAYTASTEVYHPPQAEPENTGGELLLPLNFNREEATPAPFDFRPSTDPTLSIAPDAAFNSLPQTTPPIEDKNWRDRIFDRSTLKANAWKTARFAGKAAAIYLALILLLIPVFRFIDPPGSTYILGKVLSLNSVDRTWVPLSDISPNLVRAVIVSEDGRFCEHSGVDFEAVQEALEQSDGGLPRGASTISMQVTKNLFLWSSRSILRKIVEIPLTFVLELFWPKSRIIEVYLNIAEWGDGIFGAEAAARAHFGKSAANLSEREAALLAAVLPNPLTRDAGSPNSLTSRKARVVQARVRAYGSVASCVVASQPQVDTATPAEKAKQKVRQRLAPRRDTPRRENGVPGPFFQ